MTNDRLEMIRKFFSGFEGKASPARVGMAQGLGLELVNALTVHPMKTAPKGPYVLLVGDSGYLGTPYRFEVCKHDAQYRPRQPWVNHANDSFLDGGAGPVGWMELPGEIPGLLPKEPVDRFEDLDTLIAGAPEPGGGG